MKMNLHEERENKNMGDKHAQSGGSGFLLGILIGVLITLLITTKKGRRILKTLTDEGMEKFSDLEELFEKKLKEEDVDDMGVSDVDLTKDIKDPTFTPPVTTHHPHTDHAHQTESHVYSHHYPAQQTVPPTIQDQVHHEHMHEEPVEEAHAHIEEFVKKMQEEPEVSSFTRPVTANRRFFRGIPKRTSN